MKRSVKMEIEWWSGGGAPRKICPGNALQIARKFGKRLLSLVIIASLMEKELQTLYFQVQHIVYTLKPFMVVLNLRRPLQEYVRHHEGLFYQSKITRISKTTRKLGQPIQKCLGFCTFVKIQINCSLFLCMNKVY